MANLRLLLDVIGQVDVLVIILNSDLFDILCIITFRLVALRFEIFPVQLWLAFKWISKTASYISSATYDWSVHISRILRIGRVILQCRLKSLTSCWQPLTHFYRTILHAMCVILEHAVSTPETDIVIHSKTALTTIIFIICRHAIGPRVISILLLFMDWLSWSHELVILVLWRQVKQGIGGLHVANVIVLGGHHDKLSLLYQNLNEASGNEPD